MNDRLSPEAQELVTAARSGLAPRPDDVDRLRARILLAAAAGAAAGAAGASVAAASTGGATAASSATVGAATATAAGAGTAASAAAGIGLIKIVAVVAAVTGASVTGGVLATRSDPPTRPTPSLRAAAPDPDPDPAAAPDPDPAPDRDPDPGSDPASDPDPVLAPAPPPIRTHPRAPSLSDELSLLRRARSALRSGDPVTALEHLERHARQFPSPRLAPEAAAVRIEATCAAGQVDRARQLADDFLARWPDSPLARRVPRLCGGKP